MSPTFLSFALPFRQSSQRAPMSQALRQSRLLTRLKRWLASWPRLVVTIRLGRPDTRIVYFGKHKQFVAIGTMVRRAGEGQ